MRGLVLEGAPVSVDVSGELLAIGLIDGSLTLGRHPPDPSTSATLLAPLWAKHHKTPLRRVRFGTQNNVWAITKGKSLVDYDVESGKKRRVKVKAHTSAPFALLPFTKGNFHVVATGDEAGVVRLWDFRAEDPLMVEFTEHEDYVSDLGVTADGRELVSTSADATLCSYSVSGKKVLVQSEQLSSELLSVTNVATVEGQDYFACSSGDGHIELFREGEYGNILERLETRHKGTVDCVRSLPENPNFLLTASNDDGAIKLAHLHPHRVLATLGHHEDGTEEICVSESGDWVISVGHDSHLRFWDLKGALAQVPMDTLKGGSSRKVLKKMKVATAVSDPTFFHRLQDSALALPTHTHTDSDSD